MKHICVVFGGNGSESEISFKSSRFIIKALNSLNYRVSELNFSANFLKEIQEIKPEIVFNAMHGKWGEDGVLPSLLDFLQIPYTHAGREASQIAINKFETKQIASSLGIPTLKSQIYSKDQILKGEFQAFDRSFLKPLCEGSTIGCFYFDSLNSLPLDEVKKVESDFFLLEEFFEGTDIAIAILGERAIGGIEIRPLSKYYDYEAKYTPNKTKYITPPNIAPQTLKLMEEHTLKLHNAINIKGFSRADFLVHENDFKFLEINTHPGFTDLSLVPQIAKTRGISFEEIVEFLVQNASYSPYSK